MALRRSRVGLAVVVIVAMTAMLTSCTPQQKVSTNAPAGVNAGPDGKPAPFREPVRLSSKDGVLEVRLSAHQGTVNLDTVKEPVNNFLVFGFDLIKGTSSDGSVKGDNLYPGPTLRVDPGERMIVHYDNDLQGLTIKDFYDQKYTPVGQDVPIYPPAFTEAPLNLHTHGLHVSPQGNADNVLLSIPAGMGNTYTYDVPKTMPNGLYWYHSHRHMVTAQQTYYGLSGLLEIGRPDGNIPIVSENKIPLRDMAIQYNYVFDRNGAGHQLNNMSWPKWVSTLKGPEGSQLADGTYSPSLAPVNFSETTKGAQYMTPWWTGPLSPHNHRGQTQYMPSNLLSFSSPTTNVAENPGLPENQRDLQFTINGQFQPELKIKPGQTEIWAVANTSDLAYMTLRLTETATGNHPKFSIVGQDGNPYTQVGRPVYGDGTTLDIPPGSRFAIAVTMPKTGDLVLEFPPDPHATPVVNPGVLYTNTDDWAGKKNPPGVLGTLTADPKYVSYADGFFIFPTQTLIHATPDASGEGRTTAFEPGQNLDAYTSFVDTSVMTPAVTRALTITSGLNNQHASKGDPKAITYEFDGGTYPNVPLIQPRLNSVEEWSFTNFNNDAHPTHIHVNDFQVISVKDPNRGDTGVQPYGLDNVNVPAPLFDDNHKVTTPSALTLRQEFLEYAGTYVIHCHRLNHEDNGLMATINVIPEVSTYAVAIPGANGKPASVQVRDANGDRVLQTVFPFPNFDGTPSVAMADVNGDMILDLVVGTGKGASPEVAVYDGNNTKDGLFKTELARFAPFEGDFTGGVTVAGADIDGNALADNIIVGSGPGMESQVKVFSSTLPSESGKAPDVFSAFTPYPGSQSGVALSTGLVESGSGRESVVTAPGPGEAPLVKTFRWDLYTPTARAQANGTTPQAHGGKPSDPRMTAQFMAYDQSYQGGVSLSTGWVAGAEGGAKSIVTGQLAGDGTVRTFSSGSALDGQSITYLEDPNDHGANVDYRQTASFVPFAGGSQGVAVATTSTTYGADLLITGATPAGAELRKYSLGKPAPDATDLVEKMIGTLPMPEVSGPAPLGGR
jgi:FtsP/CotA-like multicopper oxidase with cupredoxin domain